MVSARLLADIDEKLRSYHRSVDPFARNAQNRLRPFAGVSVLFSGDVWQLPPADGGLLGDISRQQAVCTRAESGVIENSIGWRVLKRYLFWLH